MLKNRKELKIADDEIRKKSDKSQQIEKKS